MQKSMTTAARLAISRAFFARFARRGIHCAVIIAFCFASAIGTNDFIRVYFHQLVKTFSAIFAFVL